MTSATELAVLGAAELLIIGFGVPLAVVDFQQRRLPNRLVALLAYSTASVLLAAWLSTGNASIIVQPLLWGGCAGIAAVSLAAAWPRALGMGDAKLIPSLGALVVVCSVSAPIALFGWLWVASVTGSVDAVVTRVCTRRWPTSIAYGPHLLLASALCCVLPL